MTNYLTAFIELPTFSLLISSANLFLGLPFCSLVFCLLPNQHNIVSIIIDL